MKINNALAYLGTLAIVVWLTCLKLCLKFWLWCRRFNVDVFAGVLFVVCGITTVSSHLWVIAGAYIIARWCYQAHIIREVRTTHVHIPANSLRALHAAVTAIYLADSGGYRTDRAYRADLVEVARELGGDDVVKALASDPYRLLQYIESLLVKNKL